MIDTCPNCDADLELIKYHDLYDYAADFQMNCPKCEALLNIDVQADPVFYVTEEKDD